MKRFSLQHTKSRALNIAHKEGIRKLRTAFFPPTLRMKHKYDFQHELQQKFFHKQADIVWLLLLDPNSHNFFIFQMKHEKN